MRRRRAAFDHTPALAVHFSFRRASRINPAPPLLEGGITGCRGDSPPPAYSLVETFFYRALPAASRVGVPSTRANVPKRGWTVGPSGSDDGANAHLPALVVLVDL